jgi:hypothetical protein
MPTHPDFTDILLHSDDELTAAIGRRIVGRETIHVWPLSCVQRLVLDDGTRLIYKSQLPPTVESRFYERASSALLPGHQSLGRLGNCETMTIEWIEAPLLTDQAHSPAELAEHGHEVIAQIGEIAGDLPTYLDIGSIPAWSAEVEITLEKLEKLILDRRFPRTDLDAVQRVRTWAASAPVTAAIAATPRLTHGDLKADQIFVTTDGYRVIDWQRPIVAPPETDLVSLLVCQNFDPRPFVADPIVGIFWFLRLHWAVTAQHDLFPANHWPAFDQWAAEAIGQIL